MHFFIIISRLVQSIARIYTLSKYYTSQLCFLLRLTAIGSIKQMIYGKSVTLVANFCKSFVGWRSVGGKFAEFCKISLLTFHTLVSRILGGSHYMPKGGLIYLRGTLASMFLLRNSHYLTPYFTAYAYSNSS